MQARVIRHIKQAASIATQSISQILGEHEETEPRRMLKLEW